MEEDQRALRGLRTGGAARRRRLDEQIGSDEDDIEREESKDRSSDISAIDSFAQTQYSKYYSKMAQSRIGASRMNRDVTASAITANTPGGAARRYDDKSPQSKEDSMSLTPSAYDGALKS